MADKISHVFHGINDRAEVFLTDGTRLHLTEADVEMMQLAFPSECEACGFDPSADPFDDPDED